MVRKLNEPSPCLCFVVCGYFECYIVLKEAEVEGGVGEEARCSFLSQHPLLHDKPLPRSQPRLTPAARHPTPAGKYRLWCMETVMKERSGERRKCIVYVCVYVFMYVCMCVCNYLYV